MTASAGLSIGVGAAIPITKRGLEDSEGRFVRRVSQEETSLKAPLNPKVVLPFKRLHSERLTYIS